MARLHHMAQRLAVVLLAVAREFAEVRFVYFLLQRTAREWPSLDQLGHAGVEKPFDGVARLRQHAPVDRIAHALHRENEPLRRLLAPLGEGGGRLRAIERAVDLDRGQVLARVLQLARMWQAVRIEHPAPGLERPPADAGPDRALLCHALL